MPFKIVDEQKRFKFELSSAGLPIADVERMGSVFWVMCCPLCGCIHDLSRHPETVGEFEPKCLLPRTHTTAYGQWIAKQPTAPAYTRISLRQRQGDIIPLDTPAKRTRKAA